MKLKTVKYKGFTIQEDGQGRYNLYIKEEWEMGKGFRYAEHDTCTIAEAKEFINDWGN